MIFVYFILFAAMLFMLIFVNIKNKYRNKLLNALPYADKLKIYQDGVCEISKYLSPKVNDSIIEKVVGLSKYDSFWRHVLWYRFKNNRYFAYNQFPVVFISSYGNISEVSRRKFSSGEAIDKLSDLRSSLKQAIIDNNAYAIMFNLAEIYRFMYSSDSNEKADSDNLGLNNLKDGIGEVVGLMDLGDMVNAYIHWRRLGHSIEDLSDLEMLVYGSVRLHLEKYIISYKYPVDPEAIYDDIRKFTRMLKVLNYWSSSSDIWEKKWLRDSSIMFVLDMLGWGLKYEFNHARKAA